MNVRFRTTVHPGSTMSPAHLQESMEDLSFEPALYLCLLQGLLLLCAKRRSKPWAGSFLTCGLAPSNMCSLVYKNYIIVQNIALDRVVCVCTSAQPHTAPAIAISPHARTTGLILTRGSYHSDQYGSCTSSCFSTH